MNPLPKPSYLTPENSAQFKAQSVVNVYHLRLPYPNALFSLLADLITDQPRVVLDAGTGTGDLARQMVDFADRIDAVDFSEAMLNRGKTLPGGSDPKIHWIYGPLEEVALRPPYALVTAGESIHWMDWETVFPRFREMLTPNGLVAIIYRKELDAPWQDSLNALTKTFSQNYEKFNLMEQLSTRNLFRKVGEKEIGPVTNQQSIEDYIASFHSHSNLSLERMTPENAAEFDSRLRSAVKQWSANGLLTLQTVGIVMWGKPLAGESTNI
jgi:ubiquinone/menaquinone biosynthesis C-methylase UbiE